MKFVVLCFNVILHREMLLQQYSNTQNTFSNLSWSFFCRQHRFQQNISMQHMKK